MISLLSLFPSHENGKTDSAPHSSPLAHTLSTAERRAQLLVPYVSAKTCEGDAGGPRTQEALESGYQATGTKSTTSSQDQASARTTDWPEETGEGRGVTQGGARSHHAPPLSAPCCCQDEDPRE